VGATSAPADLNAAGALLGTPHGCSAPIELYAADGELVRIRLNAHWAWSWGDAAFPPASLAVTKSDWLRESINT